MVGERYLVFKTLGAPGTSGAFQMCTKNWHETSCEVENKNAILSSIDPYDGNIGLLLKDGAPALTYGMGHIWFEDFVTLTPAEEVTMLVGPDHQIL